MIRPAVIHLSFMAWSYALVQTVSSAAPRSISSRDVTSVPAGLVRPMLAGL
jgi:hypothetical protein